MPWPAIPFEDTERLYKLEDLAEAETIPRLAILSKEEPDTVKYDKGKMLIMKMETVGEAVEELFKQLI
jgi:hypothetical protein